MSSKKDIQTQIDALEAEKKELEEQARQKEKAEKEKEQKENGMEIAKGLKGSLLNLAGAINVVYGPTLSAKGWVREDLSTFKTERLEHYKSVDNAVTELTVVYRRGGFKLAFRMDYVSGSSRGYGSSLLRSGHYSWFMLLINTKDHRAKTRRYKLKLRYTKSSTADTCKYLPITFSGIKTNIDKMLKVVEGAEENITSQAKYSNMKKEREQALASKIARATGLGVKVIHKEKHSNYGKHLFTATEYHVAGLVLTTHDAKAERVVFDIGLPCPRVGLNVLRAFIKGWKKAMETELEE